MRKLLFIIPVVLVFGLIGYVAYDYASSTSTQIAATEESAGEGAVENNQPEGQASSTEEIQLSGVGALEPSLGTWKTYVGAKSDFAIMYPSSFSAERKVTNAGDAVIFTLPSSFYEGTNLGSDTSLTVISRDSVTCKAAEFATGEQFNPSAISFEKDGIKYDNVLTSGAAAGNRYQEYVYSTIDRSPCFAIRFYVHSTVLENYPAGTVQAFDDKKLMKVFGQMLASFKPLK